ncbi:hypothetical protein [Cobetia marina]|uniref:hypothetical protein n=1 Tax=Cobetia marina TaxID=28258 RepID=UPI003A8CB671
MNTIENLGAAHLAMLDQADELLKKEVLDLREALWREAKERDKVLYRSFAIRQTALRLRVDWQVMNHYQHKGENKIAFTRIKLNKSKDTRPSYAQSKTYFQKVDGFHADVLARYDPLLATIREKADMIGNLRDQHIKLFNLAKATEGETLE